MNRSAFPRFAAQIVGTFVGASSIWSLVNVGSSVAAIVGLIIGGVLAISSPLLFPPNNLRLNDRRLTGDAKALAIGAFAISVATALGGVAMLITGGDLLAGWLLVGLGAAAAAVSLIAHEGHFRAAK